MNKFLIVFLFSFSCLAQITPFPGPSGGGSSGGGAGSVYCNATGGASNTLVCTGAPVPTAYTSGLIVNLKVDACNTGATTLNISSLGAKNIYGTGAAITSNTLCPGGSGYYSLFYDGTQFELLPAIPSCEDSGGSHLNYSQVTNTWSCGTSAGSYPTYYLIWTAGTIVDGACANNTMIATDASPGDAVVPRLPLLAANILVTMLVSVNDTIQVSVCNLTGASVTLGSLNWSAKIIK